MYGKPSVNGYRIPAHNIFSSTLGQIGHIYYEGRDQSDENVVNPDILLRSFLDFFLLSNCHTVIYTKGSLFGEKAVSYGTVVESKWIEDSKCGQAHRRPCYPDSNGRC